MDETSMSLADLLTLIKGRGRDLRKPMFVRGGVRCKTNKAAVRTTIDQIVDLGPCAVYADLLARLRTIPAAYKRACTVTATRDGVHVRWSDRGGLFFPAVIR